jgi:adenylate kinase family enzyme
MKKLAIIGTTGSGKSTLARRISKKCGHVYIDLDDLHHLPGWKQRSDEEFSNLVEKATCAESWVCAGNYSRVRDIVWGRADGLIWLDIPFWPNFFQLFKRTILRSYKGDIICNGNKETLARQFLTRDSILWWFLKTWHKNRKRYAEVFEKPVYYQHLTLVRFHSLKEAEEWLASFSGNDSIRQL